MNLFSADKAERGRFPAPLRFVLHPAPPSDALFAHPFFPNAAGNKKPRPRKKRGRGMRDV